MDAQNFTSLPVVTTNVLKQLQEDPSNPENSNLAEKLNQICKNNNNYLLLQLNISQLHQRAKGSGKNILPKIHDFLLNFDIEHSLSQVSLKSALVTIWKKSLEQMKICPNGELAIILLYSFAFLRKIDKDIKITQQLAKSIFKEETTEEIIVDALDTLVSYSMIQQEVNTDRNENNNENDRCENNSIDFVESTPFFIHPLIVEVTIENPCVKSTVLVQILEKTATFYRELQQFRIDNVDTERKETCKLEEVLNASITNWGLNHEDTIGALESLAWNFGCLNKTRQELLTFQIISQVKENQVQNLGQTSQRILKEITLKQIRGIILETEGRFEEALAMYHEALEIEMKAKAKEKEREELYAENGLVVEVSFTTETGILISSMVEEQEEARRKGLLLHDLDPIWIPARVEVIEKYLNIAQGLKYDGEFSYALCLYQYILLAQKLVCGEEDPAVWKTKEEIDTAQAVLDLRKLLV